MMCINISKAKNIKSNIQCCAIIVKKENNKKEEEEEKQTFWALGKYFKRLFEITKAYIRHFYDHK